MSGARADSDVPAAVLASCTLLFGAALLRRRPYLRVRVPGQPEESDLRALFGARRGILSSACSGHELALRT